MHGAHDGLTGNEGSGGTRWGRKVPAEFLAKGTYRRVSRACGVACTDRGCLGELAVPVSVYSYFFRILLFAHPHPPSYTKLAAGYNLLVDWPLAPIKKLITELTWKGCRCQARREWPTIPLCVSKPDLPET